MDDAIGLDAATLAAAYAAGTADPVSVIRLVYRRIARRGPDGVWLHLVPEIETLAHAQRLARLAPAERAALPLYGLPFAIKDNIDLAGHPTTAACPAFRYVPERSATVVERLIAAGAVPIGKTNLDQFATGLNGTRSPENFPRNPFDPAYIPGGSSSGSAVAVAAGLVSFALGTDTAGSGRIPAGLCNLVGLKPTRGRLSAAGVVPACRSLDCVSIFALTTADALRVMSAAEGVDPADPYSRAVPIPEAGPIDGVFRVAVPRASDRQFFGDAEAEALFDAALVRLEALGGHAVEIDFSPFVEVAGLLYHGPWIAERLADLEQVIEQPPDAVLPVTRAIIGSGRKFTAADTFRAFHRLETIRALLRSWWQGVDCLVVPTAPTAYRVADLMDDPIEPNTRLGTYTNFTNLLDLAAIAVPSGFHANGIPAGITLLGPAFSDARLASLAQRYHQATGLPLGATGLPQPPPATLAARGVGALPIVVIGAHMSGEPLNGELVAAGGRLVRPCSTQPIYRLWALPGTPARPGLLRVASGGTAIEGEVWSMPPEGFARFTAAIPAPLGIGRIELADGTNVQGFLCEGYAVDGAVEISEFGGWRAYRAAAAARG